MEIITTDTRGSTYSIGGTAMQVIYRFGRPSLKRGLWVAPSKPKSRVTVTIS